ncbi:MAG: cation:proton antiporter, partial [Gemmatimonadota bacterium]|nr:cation:proton antiporter [Gemmatimonadota bacterium]
VRDVFAAIFFVSVGMLIDPALVLEHWGAVAVFTILVIVGKVAAVSVGAFLAGYGIRTSVQTGMSLAQIGEFSFIIAGVGLSTGATGDFLYPVAVAVSAITTLTTPWLIRSAGPVASFVDRHLPRRLQTFVGLYGSWMERVRAPAATGERRSKERRLAWLLVLDGVLLGILTLAATLGHRAVAAAVATRTRISPGVADAIVLGAAIAIALPFAFGLIRVSHSLSRAIGFRALPPPARGGVDFAAAPRRAFTVAWLLLVVLLLSLPVLAATWSFLPPRVGVGLVVLLLAGFGVAFWRSAANLQGHTRAGAEVIVAALAKEMAGSTATHGADPTAEHPVPSPRTSRSLTEIYEMIPGLGEPVSLRLNEGDYAVGRSLGALDLRDTTDATVLVILRGGEPVILPVGREVLRAGDTLALAGTPAAVERAAVLLAAGPVALSDGPGRTP